MTSRHHDPETSKKQFAERVKNLRKQKGWSQKFLAELCGLNERYILDIERGRLDVRLSTLLAIAEAFQMQPSELIHDLM